MPVADLMIVKTPDETPFDKIRRFRSDGSECWWARELMGLVAYVEWRNFLRAIERAMASAANTGHDVSKMFVQFEGVVESDDPSGSKRQDYELTRFAAYLTVMNCDPNKPEVAAAQAYFARKTREAELVPQTREQLMALAHLASIEILKERDQQIAALAAQTTDLDGMLSEATPFAMLGMNFIDSGGTLATKEVALILQNDPAIMAAKHGRAKTKGIGEGRLFDYMHDVLDWTQEVYFYGHLPPVKYWAPKQDHNKVQVELRPRDPILNDSTGKWRQLPPQLRITKRGFFELWRNMGGTGEPPWPFN